MARAVHRLDQQFDDGFQQFLFTDDIEIGVLLSGKGQIGQVFRGRRGAHGYRCAVQFLICGTNGGFRLDHHLPSRERCPNPGGSLFQPTRIIC